MPESPPHPHGSLTPDPGEGEEAASVKANVLVSTLPSLVLDDSHYEPQYPQLRNGNQCLLLKDAVKSQRFYWWEGLLNSQLLCPDPWEARPLLRLDWETSGGPAPRLGSSPSEPGIRSPQRQKSPVNAPTRNDAPQILVSDSLAHF